MAKNKNSDKVDKDKYLVDKETLKCIQKLPNNRPGLPGGISINSGKPLFIVSTANV